MSQPYYEENRLWPSRRDKISDNPQVALIQPRECHDVTQEDDVSSNTPYKVGIEEKMIGKIGAKSRQKC